MYKLMKRLTIAVVVFMVVILSFGFIRKIQSKQVLSTPITELSAVNEKTYAAGATIKPDDFTVLETHENGKQITLSADDYTCEPTVAAQAGATTTVKITKTAAPEWSCEVEVKNKREEIASFQVGYPNLEDVQATVYSNGELEFTGTGNVKNYEKGTMPWKSYKDARNNPIVSVVFQDGVEPVSMDYWFEGEDSLCYVNKIPASVQSLAYTFADCPSLVEGPDWSECTHLTNLTGTFSEDISLLHVYPIPASVTVMDYMCNECTSIEIAPDMADATGVIYMQNTFAECTSLHQIAQLPPYAQYFTNTFYKCINLIVAPEMPSCTVSMNCTFKGCAGMTTASAIPAGVNDLTSAYAECPKLRGEMVINANPDKYNGFLSDSVVSVSLDLTGSSQMINILGLTKDDTANITVNGTIPIEE